MEKFLIFFIMIWSFCFSELPIYKFKDQFIEEINKFKPDFGDKVLEKTITKIAKTYSVEASFTNKVVDLNNIFDTCHLDFEINLVKSEELPASNHLIAHIIVGGLIIPGQEYKPKKNDLWAGNVGVAIKKDSETVYSLVYDLRVHFDKTSFTEKAGVDLSEVDEELMVHSIFYNKCLEIAEKEMAPIKISIEEE